MVAIEATAILVRMRVRERPCKLHERAAPSKAHPWFQDIWDATPPPRLSIGLTDLPCEGSSSLHSVACKVIVIFDEAVSLDALVAVFECLERVDAATVFVDGETFYGSVSFSDRVQRTARNQDQHPSPNLRTIDGCGVRVGSIRTIGKNDDAFFPSFSLSDLPRAMSEAISSDAFIALRKKSHMASVGHHGRFLLLTGRSSRSGSLAFLFWNVCFRLANDVR
jgi:hypothetical protein